MAAAGAKTIPGRAPRNAAGSRRTVTENFFRGKNNGTGSVNLGSSWTAYGRELRRSRPGGSCESLQVSRTRRLRRGDWSTGHRIQKQRRCRAEQVQEVEHAFDAAGALVEGLVADTPQSPFVLDEADHRGLIGERVIHEVASRERRDQEEGQ